MADRFPSLDDVDAGQTEVRTSADDSDDFLERERRALGEDADLFTSSTNNNTSTTKQATIQDEDDDLLGGDFSSAPQNGISKATGGDMMDDMDEFESSFPAVDATNAAVGPGGTITNSSLPTRSNVNYSSGYTTQPHDENEPEPVRAWREKRDADLARRDEASQRKKEETVNTARQDIDSFYETYNRKADRQKEQVKKEAEEFLSKREDTTSGGTAWERIAKLADVQSGKKGAGTGADLGGKTKMREMLIELSKDKNAPGSTVQV